MMKNTLFLLLFVPVSLWSQNNTQSPTAATYFQTEFIKIGKFPVKMSITRAEMTLEIKTNMANSTKSDSILITSVNPTYTALMIDAHDVDTIISQATKMFEKANSSPANPVQTNYRCNNGFEIRANWDGSNWTAFIDNYMVTGNPTIQIPVTDLTTFIDLLRQAKAKFRQ